MVTLDEDYLRLAGILARLPAFAALGPGQITALLVESRRIARSLQRLAEVECNRSLEPGETARDERLTARIQALWAPYNIPVAVSGDPRGFVVKLSLPPEEGREHGPSNDWGGETWGLC